jgi:hypothetical protein
MFWRRLPNCRSGTSVGKRPKSSLAKFFYRPTLEQLEDRTLPSVLWTNPAGGDWDTPGNWSTGNVPGASDDVVINTGGITVTHTTGNTDVVHSLTSQADLSLSAGSLSLSGASSIGSTLTISGGTLTGAGDLTVTGLLTWTGGTMSGSGHTHVNGGMTISGSASKYLDQRTIDNGGVITWSGGTIGTGDNAVINNQAGATFDVQTDNAIGNNFGGGAAAFNNAGLLKKSAGPGTAQFAYMLLNNSGTVDGQSGTLEFDLGSGSDGTVINTGTVNIDAGSAISIATSYAQTGGSTLLAGGALQSTSSSGLPVTINGGNLSGSGTIAGALTSAAAVNPGGPGASGTLTVTGTYTQTSGGTLNIELGGTGAGQFDQLNVSGSTMLNGILHVSLINGFTPAAGDSLRVLTFGARSGDFASFQGLDLGNGKTLKPAFDAASLTLTATQENPVPTTTGLDTVSKPEGNAGFTLTVNGTNFVSSSLVQWNGAALPTTFVSATGGGPDRRFGRRGRRQHNRFEPRSGRRRFQRPDLHPHRAGAGRQREPRCQLPRTCDGERRAGHLYRSWRPRGQLHGYYRMGGRPRPSRYHERHHEIDQWPTDGQRRPPLCRFRSLCGNGRRAR